MDADGNFKQCLKTGSYNLYINNEVDPEKEKALQTTNEVEEKRWLIDPYFTLEVQPGNNDVIQINLKERINTEIPPP